MDKKIYSMNYEVVATETRGRLKKTWKETVK